ncbi:MAG: hypothetical protein WKG01_34605 [Kofleriaceae bacterium]
MRVHRLIGLLFLLTVVACTGELTGGDDVPIDPPVVDVTMTVRDQGVPAANIPVVFQAPDGTSIAELMTDGSGTAIAQMPDGGSVSVIREQVVYTYVGVKPQDNLVFGRGELLDAAEVNVTVTVPAAAVGNVKITTPCGTGNGAAPTVALTLNGCATELDFLVEDDTGAFLAHAPVAGAVDFSAQTFQPASKTMIGLVAVPIDLEQTAIEKRLDTPAPFYVFSTGAIPTRGTVEATTPTLPTAEQVIVATVSRQKSQLQISSRQPFSAGPSTVDVNAGMIKRTETTTVDPATGLVAWLELGEGAPDLVTAMVTITRGDQTITRVLAAPYTVANVAVPVLPPTYAALNMIPGDLATATHALAKVTGGYDAVRGRMFAVGSLINAVPMNGTATVSYELIAN